MPGTHTLPTGPPLSAIERPRCPHCQTRTMLAYIAPGPAGYQLRTFECPRCDRVQRTLVVSDPMCGDARGWLARELKSPTRFWQSHGRLKMSAQTASSPPPVLSSSRCDRCRGVTMVQRITPSRPGYEHWTQRCTRCGHIHQIQVEFSPSQSEPLDWFDSNLYSPK
jgi:hypothetical protein